MSVDIDLDPDQTVEMGPTEADPNGRGLWRISPFAVPTGMNVAIDALGKVERVTFTHPGVQTSRTTMILPDGLAPAVTLHLSASVRAIVAMDFSPPTPIDDLATIGDRLEAEGGRLETQTLRFSLQMIGRVFKRWAGMVQEAHREEVDRLANFRSHSPPNGSDFDH